MEANRTYEYEARIAINESLENLTKGFATGPLEVQGFKVNRTMKVTLTGDEFAIQPRSDEVQVIPQWITGHNFGQWLWNVKPKLSGLHTLTLTACAVITVPNWPDRSICLETIRVPINVTVKPIAIRQPTWAEMGMSFMNNIYLAIGGLIAFLISLFTLLNILRQWKKDQNVKK